MQTNINPFQFEKTDVRVLTDDQGEPLFVAKDVAVALGYTNPSKAISDHCKGVTIRYPLQTAGGMQEVRVIKEPDVYRLIFKSKLPSAEKFEKLVMEEILPSIRKTGKYSIQNNQPERKQIKECIEGLGAVAEMLNISESGKLKMIRDYAQENAVEIVPGLPSYTVDAPKSAVLNASQGSAWVTFSATDLLKNKGYDIGARKFNNLAEENGFIERKTRHNKTFPVVTEQGLEFGKNLVSDKDARIVQPHWYENKFDELMEILLD